LAPALYAVIISNEFKNMPNKSLCVLQVLPSLVSGGVERGTIDIALALKDHGHKALVASAGGPLTSILEKHQIRHITLPLHSKNPVTILSNALLLSRLINTEKVNVLHARSRAPAWSAFIAHKITKCKFVTTVHGAYSFKHIQMLKKVYNSIMFKGERVIAVSHFIKDQILKDYTVDKSKVEIIHRGVNLAEFSSDRVTINRLLPLKSRLAIPDDKLIITIPGRVTPWKGHKMLLNAVSKLNKDRFCCLIVGDISQHHGYYLELCSLTNKLGLQDNVIFAGTVEDMPAIYALSDIVVTPSQREEAFGRVPIEAQAMGKIVVATNLGGFKETIKDKENGFLVPVDSTDALSEMINHIAEMTELEKYRIAQNARKNAELFSLQQMQSKTLSVYNNIFSS
jgi:glycosyltransferase involved in cell wall biosynthesis